MPQTLNIVISLRTIAGQAMQRAASSDGGRRMGNVPFGVDASPLITN